MKKKLAYLAGAFVLPFLAAAQTINSIQSLAVWIQSFINTIAVPFVFAIAFIVFIFGVFQTFILGRGNDEKAKEGRSLMIWGIIGFAVMASVWGLVNILLGTFNLNNNAPYEPQAPYSVGGGYSGGYSGGSGTLGGSGAYDNKTGKPVNNP